MILSTPQFIPPKRPFDQAPNVYSCGRRYGVWRTAKSSSYTTIGLVQAFGKRRTLNLSFCLTIGCTKFSSEISLRWLHGRGQFDSVLLSTFAAVSVEYQARCFTHPWSCKEITRSRSLLYSLLLFDTLRRSIYEAGICSVVGGLHRIATGHSSRSSNLHRSSFLFQERQHQGLSGFFLQLGST